MLGCCGFITIIVPHLYEISKKFLEAKQKKEEANLKDSEEFIYQIFLYYVDINEKFIDLEISKQSISCFPAQIKNRGIKRNEYIIYHLEYFYISIIAIFDRLLQLINFLYGLKIEQNKLDLKSLKKKLGNNRLKNALSNFNNALGGVRNEQNTIKHHQKHKDDKLYVLSLAEHLSENNVRYEEVVKDQHWFYCSDKRKNLTQNIEALNKYVLNILDELAPVLSAKIEDF